MSIKRNTFYNLVGSIAPMAVSLVTVPLYLHRIGEARYGVLAIVWLFLGYFGLFDMGLARATANRIAQLKESKGLEREHVFWTAICLNASFGIIGGIILYFIAGLILGHYFKMSLDLRQEVLTTLPWLAVTVPIATVSGVLMGALEGRELFGAMNSLRVTGSILLNILPLIVAYEHGPDLQWLIPAAILARVISMLPVWIAVTLLLPLRGSFRFGLDHVRALLSYGCWITINSALDPIFSSFDSFVIGSEISASAVSIYTVPYRLIHRAQLLPAALASSLFPRFSAQTTQESQNLGARAVATLAVLTVPVMVFATVIFYPFMVLWIGPDFAARSSPVGEILVFGTWMNSLAFVPYALLQGQGKPRTVALLHVIETPFLLGGVWVGVHYGGIFGAAWAMSIRETVDSLSFFFLAKMLNKMSKTLLVSGAWIVASLAVARLAGNSLSHHLIASLVLLFLSSTWVLRVEPVARQAIRSLSNRFIKKRGGGLLRAEQKETN